MSKIIIQHRDTDFMKMDSLQFLATERGLAIMSFQPLGTGWVVNYFKDNGKMPSDEKGFESYMRDCTITSKPYPTFEEMVMGEIRRLKEQL